MIIDGSHILFPLFVNALLLTLKIRIFIKTMFNNYSLNLK
ncbi:hypothetical protein NAL19_500 [Pectobacterium sp. F1-1]|nr:hypothetical protein NAL19_500 [Pectobacterium sp. F1-1]